MGGVRISEASIAEDPCRAFTMAPKDLIVLPPEGAWSYFAEDVRACLETDALGRFERWESQPDSVGSNWDFYRKSQLERPASSN